MPHQCTDCGRTFDDGSKEMLSGCPDCGGNKFQFHPDGVDENPPETEEPPEPPEPAVDNSVARTVGNAATAVRDLVGGGSGAPDPSSRGVESSTDSVDSTVDPTKSPGTAVDRDKDPGSGVDGSSPAWNDRPSRSGQTERSQPARGDDDTTTAQMAESENEAQASARSEVVSPDDLPSGAGEPTTQPGPSVAESQSADDSDSDQGDRPDLSELREELNEQFESIRVLNPGQYELNLMELYDREEYIVALQEDGKYTIQVPERWED